MAAKIDVNFSLPLTLWRTTPSQLVPMVPTERPDTVLLLKEKILRVFVYIFMLVKTEPSALPAHQEL